MPAQQQSCRKIRLPQKPARPIAKPRSQNHQPILRNGLVQRCRHLPLFENLENKASFANLNGEFYKYAQEEVKRFKIKCLDSNSKGNDLNLHYDLYTIGDSLLIIEWIYHIKMDNQPEQVQRVAYKYDLKTGKTSKPGTAKQLVVFVGLSFIILQ